VAVREPHRVPHGKSLLFLNSFITGSSFPHMCFKTSYAVQTTSGIFPVIGLRARACGTHLYPLADYQNFHTYTNSACLWPLRMRGFRDKSNSKCGASNSDEPGQRLSKTSPGFCFLMRRMYSIEIEIQNQLPTSLNKKLKWGSKYSNGSQAKMWDALIYSMVADQLPAEPLLKAHITIVRHSYRTLDYDGLVGSMKPVVDALVTAGVLSDDNWNVTGPWEVSQVFRPKARGSLLQVRISEREVSGSLSNDTSDN